MFALMRILSTESSIFGYALVRWMEEHHEREATHVRRRRKHFNLNVFVHDVLRKTIPADWGRQVQGSTRTTEQMSKPRRF
jgi:hypothetical protein